MSTRNYKQSNTLLERALKTIPIGSQTFSKSITQYPRGASPLFIERGQGSRVWDPDSNEYIDFVNALAAVAIGYNDQEISDAVRAQLDNGITFSLPHVLEMEVAELLVDMVPCAEMVRFGKNGSDATSASIRLARAYTGREYVLVCGYHGWQDWYIGSTSRDLGVPESTKSLVHTFQYNNIESLEKLFEQYADKVAAVIMEPMNIAWPENNFLASVKEIAHKNGALLVFDETITGCRFSKGGAQELFGVTPDLATFGKGLANGFPLSAVMGRRDVMMKMEEIFFSGTFGGETLSLAAAKTVLMKVRDGDVINHLNEQGQKIIDGVSALIEKHNVDNIFSISGHPSWSILSIKDACGYSSWDFKTFLLQEFFKRGILFIGSHNLSYAHTDDDIDQLLQTYDEVIVMMLSAIENNDLHDRLDVPVLEPLFKVR